MNKTLSTGTLSLRFMQNAHRAKQLKEVELERAEIQDDGKWEVSQAVRDAWGLGTSSLSQNDSVHEASYLPFMFGSPEEDDMQPKTIGRRIFNKHGADVSLNAPPSDVAEVPTPSTSTVGASSFSKEISARKMRPRFTGAQGSIQSKAPLLDGFETLDGPTSSRKGKERSHNTRSARQAIFETANVGVDLRSSQPKAGKPASPEGFLKPAGVDVPQEMISGETGSNMDVKPKSRAQKIIEGARQKQKKDDALLASNDFLKPSNVDDAPASTPKPSGTETESLKKKKKRSKRVLEAEGSQLEDLPKKKQKASNS